MKKIILAAIFVFCLIGCEYDDVKELISENTGKTIAYQSSDNVITVTIKYSDDEDLDNQYEAYGYLIDEFSYGIEDKIEEQKIIRLSTSVVNQSE